MIVVFDPDAVLIVSWKVAFPTLLKVIGHPMISVVIVGNVITVSAVADVKDDDYFPGLYLPWDPTA